MACRDAKGRVVNNVRQDLPMEDGPLHVLNIVRLADHPQLVANGAAGRLGIVSQVRQLDDGTVRYDVKHLHHEDLDIVPGIYDPEMLVYTGETATLEQANHMPAGLHARDYVVVHTDCHIPEIAGRTVLVDGGISEDDNGDPLVQVWSEELKEYFSAPPRFLTPTGERMPPPPVPRRVNSVRISRDGALLGTTTFTIVEDLDSLQ